MFSVTFLQFKQHDLVLNIPHKKFKIISSLSLNLFGEKRFAYSVQVFLASRKSINPIQKHPHIIESYACILKIFVVIFLLL